MAVKSESSWHGLRDLDSMIRKAEERGDRSERKAIMKPKGVEQDVGRIVLLGLGVKERIQRRGG